MWIPLLVLYTPQKYDRVRTEAFFSLYVVPVPTRVRNSRDIGYNKYTKDTVRRWRRKRVRAPQREYDEKKKENVYDTIAEGKIYRHHAARDSFFFSPQYLLRWDIPCEFMRAEFHLTANIPQLLERDHPLRRWENGSFSHRWKHKLENDWEPFGTAIFRQQCCSLCVCGLYNRANHVLFFFSIYKRIETTDLLSHATAVTFNPIHCPAQMANRVPSLHCFVLQ